jgi:hypothetical protein
MEPPSCAGGLSVRLRARRFRQGAPRGLWEWSMALEKSMDCVGEISRDLLHALITGVRASRFDELGLVLLAGRCRA